MTEKRIVINPGSGPVEGASERHARENMRHFLADCCVNGLDFVRTPSRDYGEGRYAFIVHNLGADGTRCHEVQMPGLPLSGVRWMEEEGQNIWDYPRLYVDGSSWVWKYAMLGPDAWKEADPE